MTALTGPHSRLKPWRKSHDLLDDLRGDVYVINHYTMSVTGKRSDLTVERIARIHAFAVLAVDEIITNMTRRP